MAFKVELNRFRTFEAQTSVPVRPITLLTGGNSSGKSSFLAALRFLSDVESYGSAVPSFNKEPFHLGAYDQIAHHRGGRYGRAAEFCLGYIGSLRSERYRMRRRGAGKNASFHLTFRKRFGQPAISKISAMSPDYALTVDFDEDWKVASVSGLIDGIKLEGNLDVAALGLADRLTSDPTFASFIVERALAGEPQEDGSRTNLMAASELGEFLRSALSAVPDASFVGAPVRTRPSRTYDPSDTTPQAEGGHVPSQLAQLARTNPREWDRIKSALTKFGKESSLFSGIEIRTLGKSESDPFQLYVTINGPKRNIIDVGYGVSQSIPFVFELVRRPQNTLYLLQQPEVHLHPEAQAALGSFLVEEAARLPGYIVIETHSDFLIDRVRRHIRDGLISKDDVSLLYFHRNGFATDVIPISIDDYGEVQDVPDGYRDFFLKEQFSNLGFSI